MSDRYKGAILSGTAPTVTLQSAGGEYTLSQQMQYQGQGVWPTAAQNPITQSLRFRASASAYLNRTPATTGNRQIMTYSIWFKRGLMAVGAPLFSAGIDNVNTDSMVFNSSDQLAFYTNGTSDSYILTTQVFRDPSAWYHLVFAIDTTQATASNRYKMYINGVQVTTFSTANYPSQNYNLPKLNNSSYVQGIGTQGAQYWDGYLGEVNFIDGVALTPSSFGTTDVNGIWQPIPYAGAYGTNGYYLPFPVNNTVSASYLVVAGGGGGGQGNGAGYGCGGGGAGGLLTGTTTINSGLSYSVTVGAGGAGGTGSNQGSDGSASSAFGISTVGGGGGGSYNTTSGRSGGSGGGGGGANTVTGTGGAGTSGQGYAGGTKSNVAYNAGAGGGGAGSVGQDATSASTGGNGGSGVTSSISGTAVGYAGGGGGGGNGYAGTATSGGGAGANAGATAGSGTANTGGGGGASPVGTAGAGGSGVVIVSYVGSARYSGGTITSSGGNTIHTFTSSGTLTALTGIVNDYSGNGNNWTANNISLASGSTYDSMLDSPSNASSTIANYCTLNPLQLASAAAYTVSNGNLQINTNSGSSYNCFANGTIFVTSGKWYAEFQQTGGTRVFAGISRFTNIAAPNSWNSSSTYYVNTGEIQMDGSTITTGASWTTGDVIGVAYDADTATCSFYKNNTLQGTVSNVTAGSYAFSLNGYQSGVAVANFGQQPFVYTPPTGFNRLNTYNLPVPTIPAGNKVMDATLYTGNGTGLGSTQTISNGNFQPDLIWMKSRSTADYHDLVDSVRGIVGTGSPNLFSNTTDAEATFTGYGVSAVTSTGFTLIGNGSYTNTNGVPYVGWQWQAGKGVTSSNTNGSITSTVSVNQAAGFSVVAYTGTGAASNTVTIGHGLGVKPAFVITKKRSGGTDYGWSTWHQSLPAGYGIWLNQTSAQNASMWNGYTNFSSTVFSPPDLLYGNESGATYINYCWAQVAGFSAFGSYTGNGSADGPFVYTGFRPKYLMIKSSTLGTSWWVFDSARSTYNVVNAELSPDQSSAEVSGDVPCDFVSNGIKFRSTWGGTNYSGATYIYACFAENPFKMARAR